MHCCRRVVILRSVMLLIRLLGPQLKSFLPLVMVLLMGSLGAGSSDAPKLQSLEGWLALVHVLADEAPAELATIANQVKMSFIYVWHASAWYVQQVKQAKPQY